jgi:DNA-binding NtrC family response regulator
MEPFRILYVDQDPALYEELNGRLGEDAADLVHARKSTEALRILQNQRVGLLVLDIDSCTMPVAEIVPIVHGIDKDLLVIVTCAKNTPETEKQVRAQKIFYYHIKSFGISDLELAVKNALEKWRAKRRASKEGE